MEGDKRQERGWIRGKTGGRMSKEELKDLEMEAEGTMQKKTIKRVDGRRKGWVGRRKRWRKTKEEKITERGKKREGEHERAGTRRKKIWKEFEDKKYDAMVGEVEEVGEEHKKKNKRKRDEAISEGL